MTNIDRIERYKLNITYRKNIIGNIYINLKILKILNNCENIERIVKYRLKLKYYRTIIKY